jgi:hypothetical protein
LTTLSVKTRVSSWGDAVFFIADSRVDIGVDAFGRERGIRYVPGSVQRRADRRPGCSTGAA